MFGECKWSAKKVGTNILRELIAKSKSILDAHDKKPVYVLFSRSGFTEALKKQANESVLMFNLQDIALTLDAI